MRGPLAFLPNPGAHMHMGVRGEGVRGKGKENK